MGTGGAARALLPVLCFSFPWITLPALLTLSLSLAFFSGFHCALVPLFKPQFSPRNLVLVAARSPLAPVLAELDRDSEDEDLGEAESPQP